VFADPVAIENQVFADPVAIENQVCLLIHLP
jgi:hypothetical protein